MNASERRGGRAEGRALREEVNARIARWLAAVRRVPPEEFVHVKDFEEIPGQARADSWLWCELLFSPEASPHNEALRARHALHLATEDTPDLLRHEYTARGLGIVVTEGRNFLVVDVARASVDLLSLRGRHRAATIRRIAADLFAVRGGPRRATLSRSTPSIEEGTTFEIDKGQDPMLLARCEERTDGGICCGCLYFVRYKRAPQRVGYLNARQWFEDDFRRRMSRHVT